MTRKTANKKPQDSGLEQTVQKEPIAIIGIGCRYPGGVNSPESFWQLLTNEVDAITNIPHDRVDVAPYYDPVLAAPGKIASSQGGFLEDVDQFDASFFGISPREANFMDPQQRLLLETAWEAIEDAGQLPENLKMSKTSVFMGVWTDDYTEKMFKAIDDINLYVTTGSGRYAASGRLSYFFGLQGPSLTLDTACSSSLVTVHLACQSLREGESTLALAGGVNVILEPSISIGYSRSKMLSPDGRSKFGDAKANGYVRSEGVGIVVLKRLSKAIADGDRIYAVIRGSAVNNDGRSSELLVAPGVQSQVRLLQEAYENAGVDPSQVGYVEAHGTGTPVGDPVELEALGTVLSPNRDAAHACRVGSVKTNFGHTEAASGVAGLIKVALSLKNKAIPASLHFKEPNPKVPWATLRLEMQTKLTPWPASTQPVIASVNSFGITGTNAHVVLTEAPQATQAHLVEDTTSRGYILPLSAKTPQALRTHVESFVTLLSKEDAPSLQDLCYTMSCRRTHHTERLAVAGKSPQELVDQLSTYLQKSRGSTSPSQSKTAQQGPVFVFSGQGAQWIGMGRELMQLEPVFKDTICEIDRLLANYVDWSLIEELLAPEEKSRLAETEVAQPAIFAIQLGITALWKSWGIHPKAVVGHSVGEIAAAHIAGVLSLEDAVRVVYHRSRLMQRVTGQGKMAAVGLSPEQAEALSRQYSGLSVGAVNSPISTVLSGDEDALKEILASLTAKGVFARMLQVNYAFHSPIMDGLTAELTNALEGITAHPANLPLYSTVRGEISKDDDYNAEYWARNIRQPVLFGPAIKVSIADGFDTFIEVSPHPVLFDSIGQCFGKDTNGTVAVSLVRNKPEHTTILTNLSSLYKLGYDVDWTKLYPTGTLVSLPGYPWQRERYWFDTGTVVANQSYLAGKIEHPLLGYRLPSLAHLSNHHVWQNKFPVLRRYLAARDSQPSEPIFREMALAAANTVLGQKNHLIRDLQIAEPLKSEGSEQIIQSTLVHNGSTASFELYSRESETADWRRHLTVNMQIGEIDTSWFYDLTWQASDLSMPESELSFTGSNWLILSDRLGVGQELASKLKDRNVTCTVVSPSDSAIDFDRLLEGMDASSTHIVYLWGLELADNQQLTSTGIVANHTSPVESLLSLVQAMTRRNWVRMPGLFVVTQGAQTVAEGQPQLAPSLMWGLGRALSLEHPNLFQKIIDLPTGQTIPSLADTILTEICLQDAEDQVVYREGQRFVPRLVPAVQSASVSRPFTLAADGTYLVTGGLGMLGLQLSRWLADHGARHLVLTGRAGLPDRDQWSSIAADTPTAQRISAVQALEERGVQVHLVRADVSDEKAMRQLFAQFGAALPPLRGLIHAAGTNANQTLADLHVDSWRDVLKPKVDGAWVLHNLTTELPLDFFVCFSSAASVWGSQGMGPYVTANHFLDQLAYYRRAQHLPALTVNWGWWAGDGIATAEQSNLFAKVGLSAMPAEKALAALAYLIELDVTQKVVADVDWNVFAPIYQSRRERPFLSQIQTRKSEKNGKFTEDDEKSSVLQELQAASPEKQREMLTDYVRQLTAEILGFDKSRVLNTREGFFKMGMDSLMTVQLRTRLEETLDCVLPHTIAFEHPTITQMAEYLAKNVLRSSDKSATSKVESEESTSETDLELEAISEDDLLNLLDDELARVDDLTK